MNDQPSSIRESESRRAAMNRFLSSLLIAREQLRMTTTDAAYEDVRRLLMVQTLAVVVPGPGPAYTEEQANTVWRALSRHISELIMTPFLPIGHTVDVRMADLDAVPACDTGVPEIDNGTMHVRQLLRACVEARLRAAHAPDAHLGAVLASHEAIDRLCAYLATGEPAPTPTTGDLDLQVLGSLLSAVTFDGVLGRRAPATFGAAPDQATLDLADPDPASVRAAVGLANGQAHADRESGERRQQDQRDRILRHRAGKALAFLAGLRRTMQDTTARGGAVIEADVTTLVDLLMAMIGALPADAVVLEHAHAAMSVEVARLLARVPVPVPDYTTEPYTRVDHLPGRGDVEPAPSEGAAELTTEEREHIAGAAQRRGYSFVRNLGGDVVFGVFTGRTRLCPVMGCPGREHRAWWSDDSVSWVCTGMLRPGSEHNVHHIVGPRADEQRTPGDQPSKSTALLTQLADFTSDFSEPVPVSASLRPADRVASLLSVQVPSAGDRGCRCPACAAGVTHASDCGVHNMPAFPNSACDCGHRDTKAQEATPFAAPAAEPAQAQEQPGESGYVRRSRALATVLECVLAWRVCADGDFQMARERALTTAAEFVFLDAQEYRRGLPPVITAIADAVACAARPWSVPGYQVKDKMIELRAGVWAESVSPVARQVNRLRELLADLFESATSTRQAPTPDEHMIHQISAAAVALVLAEDDPSAAVKEAGDIMLPVMRLCCRLALPQQLPPVEDAKTTADQGDQK